MNIQQLESFLWVARLGSVTDACKRLHVTQSTLSMRIKALESDLRITLFDRTHKRLTLTAKGRDLVRYAEKIVATVKQVEMYVADPAAQSGTIRVGVAELIALTWGAALFRKISILYPKVVIDLDIGVPRPLTDALANGALDVVLAPILGEPEGPFPSMSLGRVEFSWVGNPSLELGATLLTPSDLEQLEIIGVAGNQSVIHWSVQQWFAEHGATMQHHNVCNSLAASAAMVVEGLGISLLPKVYCAPYVESGHLKVLPTNKQFVLEFYACYSALDHQTLPRQVAELAREMSTFASTLDQVSSKNTKNASLTDPASASVPFAAP